MPNIRSAKKALRQSIKRRAKNSIEKRMIHDAYKQAMDLARSGKKEEATKQIPSIYKLIDKATKRNLIHRNKASRKKSQLAKAVKEK